jgi:hypothetical protein
VAAFLELSVWLAVFIPEPYVPPFKAADNKQIGYLNLHFDLFTTRIIK